MHTSGTGFSGPAYSISLRHPLLSVGSNPNVIRESGTKRKATTCTTCLGAVSSVPVGSGSSAQLMETNQSREDYKRSSMATIRAFVDDLSRETVSGLASTTNTST
jgi:hypothetical protein